MYICEAEFKRPDHKDPHYSLAEVDFYSHIPPATPLGEQFKIGNHRLSLRKNLQTGQYEVTRTFFQRYLTSQKVTVQDQADKSLVGHVTIFQNRPTNKETIVVFDSSDLREAIRFASGESKRFWSDLHSEEDDKVCEHKPPHIVSRCEIWAKTPIDEKMTVYTELRKLKKMKNPTEIPSPERRF